VYFRHRETASSILHNELSPTVLVLRTGCYTERPENTTPSVAFANQVPLLTIYRTQRPMEKLRSLNRQVVASCPSLGTGVLNTSDWWDLVVWFKYLNPSTALNSFVVLWWWCFMWFVCDCWLRGRFWWLLFVLIACFGTTACICLNDCRNDCCLFCSAFLQRVFLICIKNLKSEEASGFVI